MKLSIETGVMILTILFDAEMVFGILRITELECQNVLNYIHEEDHGKTSLKIKFWIQYIFVKSE